MQEKTVVYLFVGKQIKSLEKMFENTRKEGIRGFLPRVKGKKESSQQLTCFILTQTVL